jgi:hypothetical protein
VGCEASDPLNRFVMYVDARKTMNNLNRNSRIIACRLNRLYFTTEAKRSLG